MIDHLLEREIEPHFAPKEEGQQPAHARVRMRQRGMGYKLSQRCRKRIEELFGEEKEYHGLQRYRRRRKPRVENETWMIAWVLNSKRLASTLEPEPSTS